MYLDISGQLQTLGYACLLGICLGLYYEVYRICRVALLLGKWAIFVQDVLYFASAAVVVFIFCLNLTDGQVRLYILVGAVAGWCGYYFTLGRLVYRVLTRIVSVVRRLLRWLYRLLLAPVMRFIGYLYRKASAFFVYIFKKCAKVMFFWLNPLKNRLLLLYTNSNHRPKRNHRTNREMKQVETRQKDKRKNSRRKT